MAMKRSQNNDFIKPILRWVRDMDKDICEQRYDFQEEKKILQEG